MCLQCGHQGANAPAERSAREPSAGTHAVDRRVSGPAAMLDPMLSPPPAHPRSPRRPGKSKAGMARSMVCLSDRAQFPHEPPRLPAPRHPGCVKQGQNPPKVRRRAISRMAFSCPWHALIVRIWGLDGPGEPGRRKGVCSASDNSSRNLNIFIDQRVRGHIMGPATPASKRGKQRPHFICLRRGFGHPETTVQLIPKYRYIN